ncbi:hypothetical protein SLE2022_138330 [Rubroshorea leprosula]
MSTTHFYHFCLLDLWSSPFPSPNDTLTFHPALFTFPSETIPFSKPISRYLCSYPALFFKVLHVTRTCNTPMKRLLLMISLNVGYSTGELGIGQFTGRISLVSAPFHLTFGFGRLSTLMDEI